MCELSVVIPCYKSELFLEKTVQDIELSLANISHEIILVDDSSPDKTYQVIEKIVKEHKNIVGISLSRNFGQHAALMAGFHHTKGKLVLCMDDDGQTPASEITKLLNAINDEIDVVYAEYEEKKHSFFRNIGSKVNSKMTEWMLKKPKDLYISSFFVCKRYVIEEILRYENAYPYVIGLVLRTTSRITNVKVNHAKRAVGQSGYSILKLFSLWMNGFTAFSVKPLRIADFIGVVLSLSGFGYAIYLIVKRLIVGYSFVVGWNSLMCVILILGGIIVLTLGLVGEYIGRIYICSNKAPQFVIRKNCNNLKFEK